jgi:hypothetical protein
MTHARARAHARTHTHRDTHSIGILWTRDRSVAETSILQYTTLTKKNASCPRGIRSRHVSNREAAGPRLWHLNHWNQLLQILHLDMFICVTQYALYLCHSVCLIFVSLSMPYICVTQYALYLCHSVCLILPPQTAFLCFILFFYFFLSLWISSPTCDDVEVYAHKPPANFERSSFYLRVLFLE